MMGGEDKVHSHLEGGNKEWKSEEDSGISSFGNRNPGPVHIQRDRCRRLQFLLGFKDTELRSFFPFSDMWEKIRAVSAFEYGRAVTCKPGDGPCSSCCNL